jgi:broad specificity phosphatase PhoE
MRAVAGTHDPAHPLVAASQRVRDPALSEVGRAMAAAYGPRLCRRLAAEGFPVADALIASSGLRRAADTAALLFPGCRVATLPHIMEHGAIPENTPGRRTRRRRTRPSWRLFLRHLATATAATDIVVVSHGSFLRDEVWSAIAPGRRPHGRLENLAGFLVEGQLSPTGRLRVERLVELPYTGAADAPTDRCGRAVEDTIAAHQQRCKTHKIRRDR